MNTLKITIGLALVFCTLITGCKKKGYEETKEIKKSDKEVSGKYHNKDDHGEYIEFKPDKVGYMRKKFWDGYDEIAGKWRLDGDELLFINSFGDVYRYRFKGYDLVDSDGKIWLKQGKIPETSTKKVTKSQIVGRYTLEIHGDIGGDIEREPGVWTFRKDGTITADIRGKWEIEKDRLKLYHEDQDEIEDCQIKSDFLDFHGATLRKEKGAGIIKIIEVPVFSAKAPYQRYAQFAVERPIGEEPQPELPEPQPELPVRIEKATVWSDYSFTGDGKFTDFEDLEQINLKLKRDSSFSMFLMMGIKWKVEKGIVKLYMDEEHELSGKVGEDFMTFTYPDGSQLRFIREGSNFAK